MRAKEKMRAKKKANTHVFSLTSLGKLRLRAILRAFKALVSSHENNGAHSKDGVHSIVEYESFS